MIIPVILSGGSGSRLWPLSRAFYPKQMLPLVSDETMIQETAGRVWRQPGFAPPVVVCNGEHRFLIAEQLRAAGIEPSAIILEPVARNTAFAIAAAAAYAAKTDPAAGLLIMPADHAIAHPEVLREAALHGLSAALEGNLVTFGVRPHRPETGYGYIRVGQAHEPEDKASHHTVFTVDAFVEKPSFEVATAYVADGRYLWNSGTFLFGVAGVKAALQAYAPSVLSAAEAAVSKAVRDLDFLRLDEASAAASPDISIDYAVMEPTDRALVVPVDLGWTDVGSFAALHDVAEKDDAGNALSGDVIAIDSRDSFIRAEHGLIAAVGLRNMVVVGTEDAVLVAERARAQDIKKVVEVLNRDGRVEAKQRRTVHRPWGRFRTLEVDKSYHIKRLEIAPRAKISLQKHEKRAEHWVVVAGAALVTCNEETREIRRDQSVFIPIGATHSVENPGDETLIIIEVQSGGYIGEDDIVRFENRYGADDG